MTNKDEILSQIAELESQISQSKSQWYEKNDGFKDLSKRNEAVAKAYEEVRRQYDESNTALRQAKLDLQELAAAGRRQNEQLEALKRQYSRLTDSERIQEEYNRLVDEFREKCLEAPWREENRDDGFGAFPHQLEGAINLAIAKQALLGDKRGLGKTLTHLIWQDYLDARKVISIVPNDTMGNYIKEIKFWSKHRSVIKIGNMPKAQRDFLLPTIKNVPQYNIVLNYEAWRRDPNLIKDLVALRADTLILDEAHHAKTLSTNIAKGVMGLRFGLNQCPKCDNTDIDEFKYTTDDKNYAQCKLCGYTGFVLEFCSIQNVLPMTGTPILNRPQELFPQARIIDPANFRTEREYLEDFCIQGAGRRWYWIPGGDKKVVKVLGKRYIARDRKAAGIIIPPAQPVDHVIPKSEMEENYPKQFAAYEQAREYGQIVLDPERQIAMSMIVFIEVLLRLRQVLVWPAAIKLKYKNEAGLEVVHAQLNVEESIKIDKAEELLTEIYEEGDRSLLFSMFKPGLGVLQERLTEKGIRVAIYDGDTPKYLKNEIENDFDPKTAPAKPKWDILLGNYKSMGEGLNLNSATQMVLLDRHWNPAGEDQAAGRIDRIGTIKDTTIHRIAIEGTIDTWMASLIAEKASIVGGFESQAKQWRDAYDALLKGEM